MGPGLPSGFSPCSFPTNNLYAFLFSLIRTTYPAHLILLDLIILIALGERTKATLNKTENEWQKLIFYEEHCML
jgi:hypothetical protein